jgi:hypothetical protein
MDFFFHAEGYEIVFTKNGFGPLLHKRIWSPCFHFTSTIRVTRLGEFSPIKQWITLVSFTKIIEVDKI